MTVKIFEVGGHVRDSFLGISSKDIDMAVEASSWSEMKEFVEKNTKKIFLETPEFLTIRALGFDGLAKDFVLCRKDGSYSDGRRPDSVEPGTIFDDLARRDFTVNAIAKDADSGEILDPFGGIQDLKDKRLRCVGETSDRFLEDSLRIIRAFRFWITKDLNPDDEIIEAFQDKFWAGKMSGVSEERVREEIEKCFRHDTPKTLSSLQLFSSKMIEVIFGNTIWLKPTMEKK